MTAFADFSCTACLKHHRLPAARIRFGSRLICSHCGAGTVLDAARTEHCRLVERAKLIRIQRRIRLEALRQGWVTPPDLDLPPIGDGDFEREMIRILRSMVDMLDRAQSRSKPATEEKGRLQQALP